MFKSSKEKQRMTVADARSALQEMELEKHLNSDQITKDAVQATEADGIVFIDEIDKIVTSSENRYGADASSEGVQRDLLPIIEGRSGCLLPVALFSSLYSVSGWPYFVDFECVLLVCLPSRSSGSRSLDQKIDSVWILGTVIVPTSIGVSPWWRRRDPPLP
jgi:hypothetical protein